MKKILRILCLFNLVLAVAVITACIYRSGQLRAVETESLSSQAEKKKVALTFDDGPSPECTEELLEGLRERNVKATFFLIGKLAEENPDLVKKIHEDGHIIGNHSYTHVNLGVLSQKDACREIEKTNEIIYNETGEYPEYLRSPFGSTKAKLDCGMNMIEVLWDVDPRDWQIQNTAQVVKKVVTSVQEGDIILLHDGYDTSVEAAFEIIDTLKAQNYEFVTVEEMIFQ